MVINGHKSGAHTDCQMAALVGHALVEVCTVSVLLVVLWINEVGTGTNELAW